MIRGVLSYNKDEGYCSIGWELQSLSLAYTQHSISCSGLIVGMGQGAECKGTECAYLAHSIASM